MMRCSYLLLARAGKVISYSCSGLIAKKLLPVVYMLPTHVHVCALCSFHQDVRINIPAGKEMLELQLQQWGPNLLQATMMLTTELLFPFLCQLFIFFIIFINFIQLHFSQNFSPCWWRSWRDRDSRFWWWSTDVLLWKCFRRSNHPGVSSTWNLLSQEWPKRDFSPQYLYIFM